MGICRAQGGSPNHNCLISDLLSPSELRASGAEGSRTLTFPLKRRKRCRYATTPNVEWAYAFESCGRHHLMPPLFELSEVESNHRRGRSALKGQYPEPIDERAVCIHRAQWVGRRSNPRLLVFSQALDRLSYRPKSVFVLRYRPALGPRPWPVLGCFPASTLHR